jgi:hypothetical protein
MLGTNAVTIGSWAPEKLVGWEIAASGVDYTVWVKKRDKALTLVKQALNLVNSKR